MKKIDRETVQKILDAADIVEVVSDFVSLKKRGANYIGLCPFHNERTPSFSVSRTKGICKCFSCGKGGSPVNFIMEHEQLSYQEALRYLAKKYHIEISEHEVTDEERERASEREALLALNDFAADHFQKNLDTTDGRDIGLAYFRERGINELMVSKFRLGYALDRSDALISAATSIGYDLKHLITSGLCVQSERGAYDRFKGRVIYPVFSVSGRVIAFGGRTLRKDKNVAKYVNSPESPIYHKSNELYGLYQAKSAIAKLNKCILVEGYMDVISMHQVGVENVVASSGTSLTTGQIRLIHRFTDNVTVIYDSDPAGIKASLRGIDLLLAEGLSIKVLLLPDGEDPDSFAQSHSASEVEAYIAEHETDFITFKTQILLKDAGADPIARARVINDIVQSIAVIPDQVTRAIYLQQCSRMLDIDEKVLSLQLSKSMAENLEKRSRPYPAEQPQPQQTETEPKTEPLAPAPIAPSKLYRHELVLAKYIVKYGLLPIALDLTAEDADSTAGVSVVDFIASELQADEIAITSPVVSRIMEEAMQVAHTIWPADRDKYAAALAEERQKRLSEGIEQIRQTGTDIADMTIKETQLIDRLDAWAKESADDYASTYLQDVFLSSPDDEVRQVSTELAAEKYRLSKVHTKYAHIETEQERLPMLVERAVWELKYAILDIRIEELNRQMKQHKDNPAQTRQIMNQLLEIYQTKTQFAKALGDRIVPPK